jgi:hypothetical protein
VSTADLDTHTRHFQAKRTTIGFYQAICKFGRWSALMKFDLLLDRAHAFLGLETSYEGGRRTTTSFYNLLVSSLSLTEGLFSIQWLHSGSMRPLFCFYYPGPPLAHSQTEDTMVTSYQNQLSLLSRSQTDPSRAAMGLSCRR